MLTRLRHHRNRELMRQWRRSAQDDGEKRMETNERRRVTPGTNDAIIWAEGVIKTYDTGTTKVQALKEIDFVVRRGEMIAVMGPSGCGKTTLLNTLSGL